MPAGKKLMNRQRLWDVVNYMRTLKSEHSHRLICAA